jgi:DnaK suppressor protein
MKKKKTKLKAKSKAKPRIKAKSGAKSRTPARSKRAKVKNVPIIRTMLRKSANGPIGKTTEEKALSSAEIQKFRDILTEKQEELSDIVHRKKEEQEFQQEEPEIGDEADIATRSVEKEILFDITDSEKQTLDGIEAALRKIEKGVFGRCESCHKTIPRLRLEVMPWARYCIDCQSRNEIPTSGPVE